MLTHGWRRFTWQDTRPPYTTAIKESPERAGEIYGYVLDKNSYPRQADVYLIEYGGKNRIAKVTTTSNGQFAFKNVDFSGKVSVATRTPNTIWLFSGKPDIPSFSPPLFSPQTSMTSPEEDVVEKPDMLLPEEIEKEQFLIIRDDLPFMDFEDNDLSEVVVVGYGTIDRKSRMTGAISVVNPQDALSYSVLTDADLKVLFSTKIGNIMVQPDNIDPEKRNNLSVRNVSSFGNGTISPAIIQDGILLSDALGEYSFTGMLMPSEFSHLTISKSPKNMYRLQRAANGLISLESRKAMIPSKIPEIRYTEKQVPSRVFYTPPVFRQEEHNPSLDNTTVYWNADVKTGQEGKAELFFKNNAYSSSFRITAEGISSSGLIGKDTYKISTQKPFAVDVKTPFFASFGDTVKLPVMVTNATDEIIPAQVALVLPEELQGIQESGQTTEIQPGTSHTFFVSFTPADKEGEYAYSILATGNEYAEEITGEIVIRSVYFPQQYSLGGRKMEDTLSFHLPERCVQGSFRAEAVVYTNVVDELFAGMKNILREPYGCFEQASSSTFLNIMALQVLQQTGEDNEEIREKAISFLEKGYNLLSSFEVKGGGFEWFGKAPAHTGLTAYGLLEFYEMNKVYDKVDKEMTARARKFVLERRDGKGGFMNDTQGYDNFSGSPKSISDAYIVYVLTEINEPEDITKEYRFALQEAQHSKDLYRMALMANAAYNMKDMEAYRALIGYFADEAASKGFDKMKMETSIVRSHGRALILETVALWTSAMLKSPQHTHPDLLNTCINYISSNRTPHGGFGNTQSTILCLQVLMKYASGSAKVLDNGQMDITTGRDSLIFDLTQVKDATAPLAADITSLIKEGENELRLAYRDLEGPLPYNLNFFWDERMPVSSPDCPLILSTGLNSSTVKRNETVRLNVTMQNTKNEGLPMCIAIIGIPGGMSLQPWQLKELQEKEVFDYYEIIHDNLVIYYRSLKPKDKKIIHLDLKAEIPGSYTGVASTTYVYYTNEDKYWVDGFTVNIGE